MLTGALDMEKRDIESITQFDIIKPCVMNRRPGNDKSIKIKEL